MARILTAVRPPKRATVYTCDEPICQTGAAWFDLACEKHWLLLKDSTRKNIERFAVQPGTEEYVDQVQKARKEWAAIRIEQAA